MGGLVLGQYFKVKISIFFTYADVSNRGTFFCFLFVFQKSCYKIMAFSSGKITQALIA